MNGRGQLIGICRGEETPVPEKVTTFTWAEKFESFERINSIRETNGNFDSCNSCKRLAPSRLHELHESKFPFVSRIEFIRSKLSNFSAHVNVVSVWGGAGRGQSSRQGGKSWGRGGRGWGRGGVLSDQMAERPPALSPASALGLFWPRAPGRGTPASGQRHAEPAKLPGYGGAARAVHHWR